VGSHDRVEGGICTKKRESLSLVQRRERRSKRVHLETDKEGVYSTVKVTTDCADILCREER